VGERQPGRLADQGRISSVSGPQHRPHAVAAALLLDHRADEEVAATVVADFDDNGRRQQIRGQPSLHVARAAAPQPPVRDHAAPGVVRPLLRPLDRDDVDMAG
jgi:hypothetical protein